MRPTPLSDWDDVARPASLRKGGRRIVRRDELERVALPTEDIPEFGVADADGLLQHGLRTPAEDRRESLLITWSTSDVAVCCSKRLGEVRGALAQFVEQPRVLDGDDGLSGEVLDKRDLPVGEGRTSWR